MRDILLATDFSKAAEAAFEHALALALSHKADLTLLHAGPESGDAVPWDSFPHVRETLTRWRGGPEDGRSFRDRWGIGVAKRSVRTRHPVSGILETAQDLDPEVIVLARGAVQGWGHGSVSAGTARRAASPVLVVPEGARGFVEGGTGAIRMRRVLAPVDSRPDPRPALREARRLAHLGVDAAPGAPLEVELLHVGDGWAAPEIPDALLPAARVTRRTLPGDAAEVIASRAEAFDADLILLACEGRHGLLDALFGSTTERVLARAPCPVLAIPALPD